jgi:thiamine-phosphate pyrophosphorylase
MNGSTAALASAATKLQTRATAQRGPALFLLTDDERVRDPVAAVNRLPRGAAVIARARDEDALRQLVSALAPVCRRRGVALIVAGDVRLALRHGAAGVHLSERQGRRGRPLARGSDARLFVTAAAHSLPALLRAERLGASAILLSPVFATASHPGARPLGAIRFAALVRAARRRNVGAALIALGGVTPERAQRLIAAGADGFAAIGALAAPKPTD